MYSNADTDTNTDTHAGRRTTRHSRSYNYSTHEGTGADADTGTCFLAGIVSDGKDRPRHAHPCRPRDGIGACTDADIGTQRATHSMMLMCFPALAASISRESTIPGVSAGTVTFTDATDADTDTGTCRHSGAGNC